MGYLAYYYGRKTIEERTFNHLVSTNLLKEKEFSRWVGDAKRSLRELARRPSIQQLVESLNLYGGSSSQYQLVRTEIYQEHLMPTLEEEKGFFELFIMRNKDGKVAVSTNDKEEGKFRRNEHYFLQGRSRTTVQSAYYSLSYERPMTTIGTPIKDRDGKTIGVLAGHMDLTEMSAIMAQGRELSDGEETYLVNKFNFFVTENRFEPDLPLKKALHTKGVNDCLKGKSGVGMYDDYRGIPVIGAYHWMAGRELCILTEVDQAEAFAPIVALGKSVFGIGASVGLLAIVLGIFFSRTITGPVRRLVKGTEEVGRGNLDYRQQVERGDEIGHLSRAFNQMTENLKSITASLHQEIIEHQQAEEQIQRQHQRQVALHDINVAVTSTLDLPTVLEVLLRQIDHLLPYPAAMLLLVNKETGELDRVACLNLDEQEWKRRELGIPPFAMEVIKNKHPLAITNMQTDPRTLDPEYFRKHGLVSSLEIPLIAKEEVLGVLAVLTREEHRFSTEEIDFLTTLGGEAAIAIHNSRLYEQVEKKTAEISALQTITATASESLDLDTVLQEVIKRITEIFHFDATRIFLFNPQMDELYLRASFETHPEFWAQVRTFQRGQGNVGRVAETGEPLIFEDIHEDHQYQELSHTKNTQKAGLSFLGIFPIKSKLRTLGAILCMGRDPRHLTSDEIQLITSMTDQIGISVENANLFEETRDRAKELSALYSVATAINQSLDTEFVLRTVMEKTLETFHFDAARIYLFDDDKKELCLLAQQGFPMNALPESYKPGQGILGKVFEKGEPILFEDIQSDPMFRRMIYKRIALKAGFRGSFGATQGGVQDFGLARELIANGQVPPPDAFVVEGMFSEHDLGLEGDPCVRLLCLRDGIGVAPTLSGESSGWLQVGLSSTIDMDTFERLSGRDLDYDVSAWRRWLRDKAAGVSAKRGYSVVHYFGHAIVSQNLCFIVDLSGSMGKPKSVKGTRLTIARRELIRAVEGLPEKTRFNIIVFASSVRLWKPKGAVNATPKAVQEAKRWIFGRFRARGQTSTYAALEAAFNADEELDTIFLLSDVNSTRITRDRPIWETFSLS
ncbi:MAG: GAF domain-containing protein, partial [Deltaproteobacteria bacterium]|nr:GAF domain-containing protein [Deltaproteobacteria bacterium]